MNIVMIFRENKLEIWLSSMAKALTSTENPKKQSDNTKLNKNFDFTIIADRLRTVSLSNDSHSTSTVKPVNGIPTFLLSKKVV